MQLARPRALVAVLGAVLAAAVLAAVLASKAPPAAAAPADPPTYQPTWQSVDQHPPAPEWFKDAKFGIYYHWGAFSVPAFGNEWYPRNMYISGSAENKHHIATYGDPATFGYDKFITGGYDKAGNHVQFAPKLVSDGGKWDPNAWAQLFADAGAKFAGPVAEHHDGFSMWNSKVNEWNSVDKGPHLDLVKLATDAYRAKGLKIMVAMHHAYHFNGYYDHVPPQTDPSLQKLYGQLPRDQENQLWYDKLKEVTDEIKPDMIWNDFDLNRVDEQQRLNFLSYYFNQGNAWDKPVLTTFKESDTGFNRKGEVADYERGGPADITYPYWLTDDAISASSWSYTEGIKYYSAKQMLHALIDRVSKNGNMLLNVSPKADGTIPQEQQDVLLAIGHYLKRYGESIYGTRAWQVYGEGPTKMGGGSFTNPTAGTAKDIRFTRNKDDDVLYATMLGWPGDGATVDISSLGSKRVNLEGLKKVQLLGPTKGSYIDVPDYSQDENALHVTLPNRPSDELAYVLKLTFARTVPTPYPTTGASVYDQTGFQGDGALLPVGDYTARDIQDRELTASDIASLRVAQGYRVVVYPQDDFQGTPTTYTRNTATVQAHVGSLKVVMDLSRPVTVQSIVSGHVIDAADVTGPGSELELNSPNDSASQAWQFVDVGDGYYRIENPATGLVIDGHGGGSGSHPVVSTWTGSPEQQWKMTAVGNGSFLFANRETGLVLDSGGNVPAGSPLKQWTSDGSPNLDWKLAVSPAG